MRRVVVVVVVARDKSQLPTFPVSRSFLFGANRSLCPLLAVGLSARASHHSGTSTECVCLRVCISSTAHSLLHCGRLSAPMLSAPCGATYRAMQTNE